MVMCMSHPWQAIYGNIVVRNNYEEVTKSYTTSYLTISTQSPDVSPHPHTCIAHIHTHYRGQSLPITSKYHLHFT